MDQHRGRGNLTGTTVVEVPLVDPARGHRVVHRPVHVGAVHDLLLQHLQAMHIGTNLSVCSGGFLLSLAAPFKSVSPHSIKKELRLRACVYMYVCICGVLASSVPMLRV